jgi:hypothetical protein
MALSMPLSAEGERSSHRHFEQVFWVLGSGPDVGKTTIASALVRHLNRQGISAVGFKPHAATRLQDIIDLMIENYPRSKCTVYGGDGLTLANASPLTSIDVVDVVNPVHFICYPEWQAVVLARMGSHVLGNVELYRGRSAAGLIERPDIKQLIAKTGLPLREATEASSLSFYMGASYPDVQNRAFAYLANTGAHSLVCEGAGGFSPAWQSCPIVNHIFLVSHGQVHLFPRVDLEINCNPKETLRPVSEIVELLKQRNTQVHMLPLFLVESTRRDEAAEQIVEKLLRASQ